MVFFVRLCSGMLVLYLYLIFFSGIIHLMIHFNCPKCREGMKALKSMSGDVLPCPKCGNYAQVRSIPQITPPPPPTVLQRPTVVVRPTVPAQTIEKTSKDHKGGMLFGVVMTIVGIIMVCMGNTWSTFGVLLIVAGLLIWLLARITAWWDHG